MIGAGTSNAFAKASVLIAPLDMDLDRQFYSWWKSTGRPPILYGYWVKVLKLIQGYPESQRLWIILVNKIILDLGFKPCKNKTYLYYNPKYNREEVFFYIK